MRSSWQIWFYPASDEEQKSRRSWTRSYTFRWCSYSSCLLRWSMLRFINVVGSCIMASANLVHRNHPYTTEILTNPTTSISDSSLDRNSLSDKNSSFGTSQNHWYQWGTLIFAYTARFFCYPKFLNSHIPVDCIGDWLGLTRAKRGFCYVFHSSPPLLACNLDTVDRQRCSSLCRTRLAYTRPGVKSASNSDSR